MVKKAVLVLVAFLLFVILMSLQFTSTALLSDLGFRNITVQQPETQTAYAHQRIDDPFEAAMPSGSLLSLTPLYPPFIEYSESLDRLVQGVFDTGTLIRGFLSIAQESQRQELVRYSGMATFFDNRVVCAREHKTCPEDKARGLSISYYLRIENWSIRRMPRFTSAIYSLRNTLLLYPSH
jgi:hypothetical protein